MANVANVAASPTNRQSAARSVSAASSSPARLRTYSVTARVTASLKTSEREMRRSAAGAAPSTTAELTRPSLRPPAHLAGQAAARELRRVHRPGPDRAAHIVGLDPS